MKLTPNEKKYVVAVTTELEQHNKHNKRSIEKLAATFGVTNKNLIKELTELAIVNIARSIAHKNTSLQNRYEQIVSLYKSQVNLSHRTSESIRLQQYSTPAPIAFLAGIFCEVYKKEGIYFEPSAGNGLMTIAGNSNQFIVNEVDDIRRRNLETQGYKKVLNFDASQPFKQYHHYFDAILTNPPFGTLPEPEVIGTYWTKILDHKMAAVALETMKDCGKAAIIIGGHTKYDEKGRIQKGKNRDFFLYLYRHYHVIDVINIDGHKLYSRQGTAFNVRLILIDGRKEKPGGFPPIDKSNQQPVDTFNDLYNRVTRYVSENEYINLNITEELLKTAENKGKAAFNKGLKRIFAHDIDALELIKGRTVGDEKSIQIMDAWCKGWDKANLAAPISTNKRNIALAEAEAEAELLLLGLLKM